MKVVRRNLVLTFGAADDTKIEITVLRPLGSLQGSQIKAAMQAVIDSGALGSAAVASKIVGAEYDIRQIEEVVLG